MGADPGPLRSVVIAGHTGDVATARAGLGDPDPTVRAAALGALARCDALQPADFAGAVTDPDAGVRRRAAEEAAGRGDVDLVSLLDDPDAGVVESAAWAIGEGPRPNPAAMARLIEVAATHDQALCREAAVAALGAIGAEEGLAAILAACGDRATVRRRAVLALAPFDGPEVEAALTAALEDRDWQVRQAAEDQREARA